MFTQTDARQRLRAKLTSARATAPRFHCWWRRNCAFLWQWLILSWETHTCRPSTSGLSAADPFATLAKTFGQPPLARARPWSAWWPNDSECRAANWSHLTQQFAKGHHVRQLRGAGAGNPTCGNHCRLKRLTGDRRERRHLQDARVKQCSKDDERYGDASATRWRRARRAAPIISARFSQFAPKSSARKPAVARRASRPSTGPKPTTSGVRVWPYCTHSTSAPWASRSWVG